MTVILICALILTGCGVVNDNSEETLHEIEEFSGVAVDGVDKDLADLLPDEIKDSGVLRIGSQLSYAPNEYFALDGKTPIGFEVELIRLVAQTLGLKAELNNSDFDAIIPSLGAKYDIGVSAFTVNTDRLKNVDFLTMFEAGEYYAVQKGNPGNVPNPEDDDMVLCGKTVGVELATTQDEEITEVASRCEDKGLPELTILRWEDESGSLIALMGGKVDVVFSDSQVIEFGILKTAVPHDSTQDNPDGAKIEKLGGEIGRTPQGWIFPKGSDDLQVPIQKALQKLIDDGKYQKVLKYWNVEDGSIKNSQLVHNGSEFDKIMSEVENRTEQNTENKEEGN
jgi:polar amino acid transport system substrate-binding protein